MCAASRGKDVQTSVSEPSLPAGAGTGFGPKAKVAAFAILAAGLLSIVRARRKRGSVNKLVSRGMVSDERDLEDDQDFANMMRKMNTTTYAPLSEEQIAEARRRRAGSYRDGASGESKKDDLDDFDLPEDHPWAERTPVGPDDEELVKARLAVRRGPPLQSLADKKKESNQKKKDWQ